MAITTAQIIAALEVHAPRGVELPKDVATNAIHQPTIERWLKDAVGMIADRRGRTTIKETTITLVADQQDYQMPEGTRRILDVVRNSLGGAGNEVLGIPITVMSPSLGIGLGQFGSLPNGQEISPALDLINRQRAARIRREDSHTLFSDKLRLLFPIGADEVVKVIYEVLDREPANCPDDYFTLVLWYCLYMNTDWFITKNGAMIDSRNDTLTVESQSSMFRQRADYEQRWMSGLNSIPLEVGVG